MLFLAKFLPLLVYPLGFACLLLLASLLLRRRLPRFSAAAIVITLSMLFVGGNRWTALWLARSLEWQNIPSVPLPNADAIVLLGGATEPAFWPQPWIHLTEAGDRVLYAARLYREGRAPLLILCGGSALPIPSPEAVSMAQMLEFIGIPDSAIIQEPDSLNTHQNAVNVKEILNTRRIHRVLLVTSAMHMPRAMLVFKHEGIDALPAPADFLVTERDIE
ncbi:MAG TPA: YdcF family protein, partial [Candidatus Binataceae bacterium]|nr:YdcF family protein [Candidatus Binataceae bacterium]